ncbi:MAG: anhydro-N-acetylmuramic acid kinase, partial [Mariprofundaceae bacterium]|nr:anhydro-N-acetylmuramic acid kinase [Mariprofundaceae bacterium]
MSHLFSSSSQPDYIIGIMSGTSCDGIDIAIMDADSFKLVHFTTQAMPCELRESIVRLACPSFDEIDTLGNLDRALGVAFSQAVMHALETSSIPKNRVLAIGSHGQTIRHRPKSLHADYSFTLQIACAATISEITGLTVVSDFRRRDVAALGQGAPLVPFAHQHLFPLVQSQATAIVNIGGVANITMFYPDGRVQGFDTGPGNMIMDALILQWSDGRHAYDQDGQLASSGMVCEALLNDLLTHPFLQKKAPKSTGREDFGETVTDHIMTWEGISDADRMATACAFTARSILMSIACLDMRPKQWFICGGGAFNPCLLR